MWKRGLAVLISVVTGANASAADDPRVVAMNSIASMYEIVQICPSLKLDLEGMLKAEDFYSIDPHAGSADYQQMSMDMENWHKRLSSSPDKDWCVQAMRHFGPHGDYIKELLTDK